MSKRVASSPKRGAPKRSRTAKLIPTVVDALADTEALPADLRTLLKLSLPVVLSANKADRGPYEVEVVLQAEKALAEVQAALEKSHKAALATQNEVIAPTEHANRTTKKKTAETCLEAAKAKLLANKETKKAGENAVNDAQSAVKVAEKDAAGTEKEIQQLTDKKVTLTDLLANEFALLRDGTSAGPGGKKAVDRLLKMGKEFRLDSTLLTTFHMACKKAAANRSEFENMSFSSVQAEIDRQIDALTQNLAGAEPVKAQKVAAVAGAKDTLAKAEAALAAANEELAATHAAHKEAVKELSKADELLYNIWEDMRAVCDTQDDLANDLKNFKESTLAAFHQLKEKEPEPEPVEAPEPVEESAVAEAAPAVEAAAPVAAA